MSAPSTSEWPSAGHFILRRTVPQWSPAMVRITSFAELPDGLQPDWESALAHFRVHGSEENWKPGDAGDASFQFEIPRRDGGEEAFAHVRLDGGAGGGFPVVPEIGWSGDPMFARWLAFGSDRRILGGLATATSPLLAGTSDLIHEREPSPGRRVLCAWRRVGGELLIYRRSFPVK